MVRKFSLDMFFANKHGELEHIQRWKFIVQPNIEVEGVEVLGGDFQVLTDFRKTKIELNDIQRKIRDWIFRVDNTFLEFGASVWRVSPEFNEEEKKHIKRLHLFEEL